MEKDFKVYGYRWVILLLFVMVNILMQIHWINFASIASQATKFYNVPAPMIDLFALSFMIVYLIVSFPASYIIDKWGMRIGIGIGATLMGIFALMKGFFAADYTMVLIAQFGIGIGQPFINNAITKVGVRWFPLRERATAAGLGLLGQFVGMLLTMALTPFLLQNYGMVNMLMIYGVVTFVGAGIYLIFNRECPPTPPCPPGHDERISVFAGLKHMLKQRDMIILMISFFFGLGIFNAVVTWIEQIVGPRGFSITEAGIAGSLIMLGGIIGALVLPSLSDKLRKRRIFIIIAMLGAIPGLVGMTFAGSYWLLCISCFVFGFFLIGGGPVDFQYGAEASYPAPEATSQGVLMFVGMLSGILFIVGPDIILEEGASKTPAMILFLALLVVTFVFALLLRESKHIKVGDI